jgi:hypothetical protein
MTPKSTGPRAQSVTTPTSVEIVQAASDKTRLYYDQCRSVSYRLADDLQSHGHSARVLRCAGLRTPAPDADARWHAVGAQEFWIHYVVIVGAESGARVIDLTRRQFFPCCATPFYQSAAAFAAEWDSFAPEVQNPRFRPSVAP